MTQAALGSPYYTRAAISRIEQGLAAPSLKALAHFAERLRVTVRHLIPPDL